VTQKITIFHNQNLRIVAMHQNISHNFNFYFDIVLHVADYILQCDFISQNMTISHN